MDSLPKNIDLDKAVSSFPANFYNIQSPLQHSLTPDDKPFPCLSLRGGGNSESIQDKPGKSYEKDCLSCMHLPAVSAHAS